MKSLGPRRTIMKSLPPLLSALAVAVVAPFADAAAPQHFGPFASHEQFVDTESCGFPIVGDVVSTNVVTQFENPDGTIASLQLHQSRVGTYIANGVILKENDRYTIFVDFSDGAPTQAKHVGVLFNLVGPDGVVFHVVGQEVFEVVGGSDTTLLVAHGVGLEFNQGEACAAFEGQR
jgi:hypothetical protein